MSAQRFIVLSMEEAYAARFALSDLRKRLKKEFPDEEAIVVDDLLTITEITIGRIDRNFRAAGQQLQIWDEEEGQ